MKKTNNNSTKEYFRSALQVGEDRLLKNPSKGEQALFIGVVVLAFVAFIFSAITAIMSKDGMTIARAFTENIFMLALVIALTVSDRVLVWRGRSLILILYTLLAFSGDFFAFFDAKGIMFALAVVGAIAGIAFYGTLIFDQLNSADKPVKYWFIYSGALYKVLYTLISVIVRGTLASQQESVANVLAIVVIGLADVAVIMMLIYQFDGFSFAKYLLYEIVSNSDEPEEFEPDDAVEAEFAQSDDKDDAAFVPYVEQQAQDESETVSAYKPFAAHNDEQTPAAEPQEQQTASEPELEVQSEPDALVQADQDEILDDFGYVPYDDDAQEDAFDNSVKPLTSEDERPAADEREEYEAYEQTDDGDDVLIDESVADIAHDSNVEAIEDVELDEQVSRSSGMSVEQLMASLTPTERKYVKFAMTYHKPADVLQVEGLSGDLFDVWVDGDVICFQNDLGQACDGRGVRTAAVAFSDVENIGASNYGGEECVVLSYYRGEQLIEIGFTKASFKNFKKVMMACM